MRPLPEIARAVYEHCSHADQDAKLVGDVTVGEMLAVVTFAFGAYERDVRGPEQPKAATPARLKAIVKSLEWFTGVARTAAETELFNCATELLKEAKRMRAQRNEARAMVRGAAGWIPGGHANLLEVEAHWSAEEAADRGEGR